MDTKNALIALGALTLLLGASAGCAYSAAILATAGAAYAARVLTSVTCKSPPRGRRLRLLPSPYRGVTYEHAI